MTTEKTDQKNEQEEKSTTTDCCSRQNFTNMMNKCGEGMKCDCGSMMPKMMQKMSEMTKDNCCGTE